MNNVSNQQPVADSQMHRRKFFGIAGASALALMIGESACKKPNEQSQDTTRVGLGKDDEGLLNYAYLMEQVVTRFYQQVTSQPYTGMSSEESMILQRMRDHQEVYRSLFFNNKPFAPIPDLVVEFANVDFESRSAVLTQAIELANWQAQSYNGMMRLFESSQYIVLMSKIASVKARDLGLLRNWQSWDSYAVGLDNSFLDGSKSPGEGLAYFEKYVKTSIDSSLLPKG